MLLISLLIFCLLFFLIIPVDIVFVFNNVEGKKRSVFIRLFFGLIKFQLFPRKLEDLETPPRPQKKKKRLTLNNIINLAGNDKFIRKTSQFIMKILKSIKLKLDRFYIRLGLDDPADTGMLWGFVGPFSALLGNYCEKTVKIEPEFQDSALDIDTKGNLSIIPLEIIVISLIYLFSPVTVKTVWINFVRSA